MALTDRRGHAVSTRSRAAVDAAETALWRMMSFYDTPLADLDAAIAADPAWSLPHAMKAGYLLGLTEPGLVDEAAVHLAAAEACHGNRRERDHVAAVRLAAAGDWQAAGERWAALSARHPRDALALQWGHLFDFHRGDAAALEARIAAALPAWPEGDPWRPHVVAMHAFGLEENGRYAAAEAEARAALALEPRAPWAIHAVAHVLEMQGRHDEGRRWLADRRAAWGEGDNGFAAHLGWHEALFALEALDHGAALAVVDRYLDPARLDITLQRVDAASLLWRLLLQGADVAPRCRALVDGWPLPLAHAGRSAFNDLHVTMALLGAGDRAGARAWAAAAGAAAATGGPWNRAVMERAGAALTEAVLDFADGRFDAAAAALHDHAGAAACIGGSHAQRDVVAQTLLGACARGGERARALGLAVAGQRRRDKATPLSDWWRSRFEAA